MAVDGQHIYWTANALPPVGIGRANLNGAGVNQSFMPVLRINGVVTANTGGLAVAGGYIYWANDCCGTIGRANLDGSAVNLSFIAGACGSTPMAITVADGYIYWANEGGNACEGVVESSIGRANLDGTDVNQRFIVGTHVANAVTVARDTSTGPI